MRFQQVRLEFLGEVAKVTLNRPDKLNAISRRMRLELTSVLQEVEADRAARCLILTGAGGRSFSTGEDLSETATLTARRAYEWTRGWGKFLAGFIEFPKPLVTSCQGYATGAGWQLFLMGDYRIASKNAKFSMPEIDVGLPSIMGGAVLLSVLGMGQVNRFTLTAETIDARRSFELGLVHDIVVQKQLESRTLEIARMLAGKSSLAIRLQKAWSSRLLLNNYRKAIAKAATIYQEAFSSEDTKTMIKSFFKND